MKTHMSPEGLEEVVESEYGFMTTLTQGEKYRNYIRAPGSENWVPAPKCFNTDAEATKRLGEQLILLGALMRDPKDTIDRLIKFMEKPA